MLAGKAAKEAFVTGLKGGPVAEIFRVFAAISTATLVISLLRQISCVRNRVHLAAALELASTCVWPVLTLCLPDPLASPTAAYVCAAIWAIAVLRSATRSQAHAQATARALNAQRKPFIDLFRAHLISMTNVAILAVDFHAFPRRFAKTETFGTSVMDTGVGLFVSSLGLSVGLRRNRAPARFVEALRHSIPLWLLGAVRLFSVKSVDYQEHVSEYGTHWNFFFTLALLNPLVAALDALRASASVGATADLVCAVLVLAAQETQLSLLGGASYIEFAPRGPSLFSLNREGVLSLPGYVSIYLFARALGKALAEPRSSRGWRTCVVALAAVSVACGGLSTKWSDAGLGAHVSRRFANAPFVLLSIASAAFAVAASIASCLLVGSDNGAPAAAPLVAALSRHSLAVFLLANVSTGAVNMLVDTLRVPDAKAIGLLCVYSLLMGVAAVGFERVAKIIREKAKSS